MNVLKKTKPLTKQQQIDLRKVKAWNRLQKLVIKEFQEIALLRQEVVSEKLQKKLEAKRKRVEGTPATDAQRTAAYNFHRDMGGQP